QAHMATSDEVRTSRFTFDTGASSHMSPCLDHFEDFQICSGSVKSRSSKAEKLEIMGKGSVVLDCVLKDGTVSSFRIQDVLYVPLLDRPLFSWKAVDRLNKGYRFKSFENGIRVLNSSGKTILEATTNGSNLYTIPEVTIHQAHLTYGYWHNALGHLNPTALSKAVKIMYSDADIAKIP